MWLISPSGPRDVHLLLLDAGAQEAAGRAQEVGGVIGALEADQVRAQQPVDDGTAPGQLGKDLRRRKGYVVEEPDPQVRPALPQIPGNQLQLVVLHPDRGALGSGLGRGLRETLVDGAVGIPPRAVELRWRNHVVVERPERGVGEALVIQLHLRVAQRHRDQVHVVVVERVHFLVGRPGQPTQAPSVFSMTGASAVTRPPGERRQPSSPSASASGARSTGSRLETTMKS